MIRRTLSTGLRFYSLMRELALFLALHELRAVPY